MLRAGHKEAIEMRMTLKEVCNYMGVTRRAVQGYEKTGLVQSIEKNKYGHLLYVETAIEKIQEIKQYQEFGFSIKEIQIIQDLPKEKCLEMLENRLELMRLEMQGLQENIGKMEQLIVVKRQ